MITILCVLLTISVLGIMIFMLSEISTYAYGTSLEDYIISHHPKDTGDIDRLTREFEQRLYNQRRV